MQKLKKILCESITITQKENINETWIKQKSFEKNNNNKIQDIQPRTRPRIYIRYLSAEVIYSSDNIRPRISSDISFIRYLSDREYLSDDLRGWISDIYSRSGPGLDILYFCFFCFCSKLFCFMFVCVFSPSLFKLLHLQSKKHVYKHKRKQKDTRRKH